MRREDYREARIAVISSAAISIDCWMEVLGEEVPEILIRIHKRWDHQRRRATGDLYFSLGTGRIFRVLGDQFVAPTNQYVTAELLKAKSEASECDGEGDFMLTRVLRKQALRSKKSGKFLQSANGQYETAQAQLVHIDCVWAEQDVLVRSPSGIEISRTLVCLGKSRRKAYCPQTGRVYLSTNGCFEPIRRFVSANEIKRKIEGAREVFLDSIGAW